MYRQNAELLDCLSACPGSVEKQILQMGLQPWEGICSNLRGFAQLFHYWLAFSIEHANWMLEAKH